jgi:hypothetical protein
VGRSVTPIQTGIPYNTLDNPFPTGMRQFSFEIQRELPRDFLLTAGQPLAP